MTHFWVLSRYLINKYINNRRNDKKQSPWKQVLHCPWWTRVPEKPPVSELISSTHSAETHKQAETTTDSIGRHGSGMCNETESYGRARLNSVAWFSLRWWDLNRHKDTSTVRMEWKYGTTYSLWQILGDGGSENGSHHPPLSLSAGSHCIHPQPRCSTNLLPLSHPPLGKTLTFLHQQQNQSKNRDMHTHTHMCTRAPYTHCMVLDISNGPFHTEFIHICNITPTHQTPNATLPLNHSFFFRFSDFHFNYCPLRPSTSVSVFSLQYLL